jgi:hypothetical protein
MNNEASISVNSLCNSDFRFDAGAFVFHRAGCNKDNEFMTGNKPAHFMLKYQDTTVSRSNCLGRVNLSTL